MVFVYKNLLRKSYQKEKIEDFSEIKPKIDTSHELFGTRYVTLTLRDYGYSPLRNTTKSDIEKFITFANNKNAKPVIIPDNISLIDKYNINQDICFISYEARKNIYERVFLYSESLVNIFTTSGPGVLSLYTKSSKTIFFNYGCGGSDGSLKYYKKEGLFKHQQPYLALGGYILWKNEKAEYSVKDLHYAFDYLNKYIVKSKKLNFFK